jgi:RHS repeat-associated protein
MQLSSDVQIPDGLLAEIALLREKPHQGVPSWNLAPHQGIDECNCTTAIGLRASEQLNRIGSRYTGKERDAESGLDNFEARYYGSSMGRMMSPDPLPWAFWQNGNRYDQYRFQDYIANPQNLNMYAYVLNNPLSYTDPTGMTCQTNSSDGNTYDDMDGKGCATVDQQNADRLKNGQYDATVHGGSNAAQLEVNDAVGSFLGNGPKNIEYQPNDPFTLSFQRSAGMDAINAKITANCSASSGKLGVGSGEAFVNTLIDGIAGGQGFHTPEAQLGAFNATYSHDGFTATVTVTNPISLNSAAYHATSAVGIQNPKSGPLGTVHQTLHISEPDPCNGHS